MFAFPLILSQALPVRWQSPWLLPAVLGIGAALALAVLWYYPGQVRLVRRPWRYIIPALRLLAFSALAVSLAQPVALRARPAEDKGALIVLIDRSASMGIADRGRRPAELVALADALGLLPAGSRAESSAAIAADFEQLQAAVGQAIRSQGDLDYARVSGRGIEAAEARVQKGVEEARQLGRTLSDRLLALAAAAGGNATAGMEDKLKPLAALPPADLRGAWIAETRRRLEQASSALTRFADITDRRLYDTNANVRAICQELEKRTRLEIAVEALIRPGGLLSRLGPDTPVVVYAFDRGATPLAAAAPAPLSATQPAVTLEDDPDRFAFSPVVWTSSLLPLSATGESTDITGALATAIAASENRTLRGVLLISDGQQAAGSAAMVAPVLPQGVPLISVIAAGAQAPRDAAIADVELPSAAFAGESVAVKVRLRGSGGVNVDAATVRLTVVGDDAELTPIAADKPGTKAPDGSVQAQFTARLTKPGVADLVVSLPQVDGETSLANNTVRRRIKVLPERIAVAAFAGSPGWDFLYLRSALSRRDWFRVNSAVLDPAKPRLPLTPAQIMAQDVLVLYDIGPEALDREQWYAVDRLVTQRSGSVVFIAGPGFNPAAFVDQPLASALLPFNLQVDKKPAWRQSPGERPGIRLLPGAEFLRSDVLRLADADVYNRRWQDLPGAWKTMPVRVPRTGTRVLLRDAETGLAVATEVKSGVGRAFYIGTHETWRWRGKGTDDEHERFWRQLIRYAAEEPYAAQSGRLALDLEQVSATPDANVHARIRLTPADDVAAATQLAIDPADLRLEIVRQAATGPSTATPIRIVRVPALTDGGRARVALGELPPGAYEVRLATSSGPAPLSAVPLIVETSLEPEMRNLAGDPDRLRRMAEGTGGRLLKLDQLAAVPGLLAAAADQRPRVVEWSLWDSPWLFVFVVGCLGAEWALRKRAGLA